MFALKSTNEILQLLTTSTAGIDISITWLDMDGTTGVTKSTTETKITTATSTTVLAAPASGVVRSIESVYIRNIHASTSNTVTVIKDVGGTGYYLTASIILLAGEVIEYNNSNGWIHIDADGKFFFLAGSGTGRSYINLTETVADTNATAVPGTMYYYPLNSLTTDRTFDLAGMTDEADVIQIANLDKDTYQITFVGATVYDTESNVITYALAGAKTEIRRLRGQLIILN
jgi:hypothetical protein